MKDAALRYLWLTAGVAALALGVIGFVLPLLPGVAFVILAAFCFSKGSRRWEQWLVDHPQLGPYVRDWREHHAVPMRAKQLTILMMSVSCAGTWWFASAKVAWIPTVACTAAAIWLLRLPTRR